uniref:Uncharacterized protein n=1 Tax=Oryza rufipogon TaxID=4529 RepID=A0A0E0RDW0_ORYRU
MTQKWLPSSAAAMHHPAIFSKHDMEVLQHMIAMPVIEGYVHIWQGYKDSWCWLSCNGNFKEAFLGSIIMKSQKEDTCSCWQMDGLTKYSGHSWLENNSRSCEPVALTEDAILLCSPFFQVYFR